MYSYQHKHFGKISLNWSLTINLAAILSTHIAERVESGETDTPTTEWFLTEILEHYVMCRDTGLQFPAAKTKEVITVL